MGWTQTVIPGSLLPTFEAPAHLMPNEAKFGWHRRRRVLGPAPGRGDERGHSAVLRWSSFRLEVEED